MQEIPNFEFVRQAALLAMRHRSILVPASDWQSLDVSAKPEMATHEVQMFGFTTYMPTEDLDYYRAKLYPNLPWADDHFAERVCGEPINPGEQWRHWPWSNSADKFRDARGQFNHNYMERYWPCYAGLTDDGRLPDEMFSNPDFSPPPNTGIRGIYGGLGDVVIMLRDKPLTRQAYLPIFHPEDTGAVNGGRVPCSLGYHFIRRNGCLHVAYLMRSCDLKRHFADDIYLTVRLALWVLDQLREQDPGNWNSIRPGSFSFFTSSLHIFRNDWQELFGYAPTPEQLAGHPAVPPSDHSA